MFRESRDPIGDRMKDCYETPEAGRRCMPGVPVIARLDGKTFHSWTRGLARPYDEGLMALFQSATAFLVEETSALLGYTQSDEITLLFYAEDYRTEIFFGGKIQKMASVLASMLTAHFNAAVPRYIPEKAGRSAYFDCRVFAVPNKTEAANCVLWREKDATKNSVQMLTRAHFSHGRLKDLSSAQMQELLFQEKGINWSSYPDAFKRGSYFARRKVVSTLGQSEWERIPEKHRPPRDQQVERSRILRLELPPLGSVVNRVEVLFDGAEPVVREVARA